MREVLRFMESAMHPDSGKVKVWDLPTRVFHWSLVLSVFACWFTIENRWILAHQVSGAAVLGLLIFRLLWGIVGSRTAKFTDFVKWPWTAARYLWSSLHKHDDYHTGHNPAGGWMVIAVLVILGFQGITGLFANNDLGFSGPLADHVSKDTSDKATQLHVLNFNLILALVWLHLIAVFLYVLVKRQNLVRAMITGKKPVEQAGKDNSVAFASPWTIAATLIVSAVALVIIFVI